MLSVTQETFFITAKGGAKSERERGRVNDINVQKLIHSASNRFRRTSNLSILNFQSLKTVNKLCNAANLIVWQCHV